MSHPQRGHLPIGAPVQFRIGDHVLVDGDRPEDGGWRITQIFDEHGYAVLRSSTGVEMLAMLRVLRPYAVTPDLADIVSDAANLGEQMIATLGRQFDPASAPGFVDDPWGPDAIEVDVRLGNAVADIRAAIDELQRLAAADLPPAGSAVQYPARQFETKPREGAAGPSSYLQPRGYTQEEIADALDEGGPMFFPVPHHDDCPVGSAVHVPGPPLADALDEGDGPPSHRWTPSGECLQPGSAAAISGADSESNGGPPSPGAGDSFSLPVPPDWHWLNTK